ncbi:MAG: helix-turn-helix domain-containing protein [Anaeromyxobacteraceae bacterium]
MSTNVLEAYARPREGIVRYSGIDALNDASRKSGFEFAQSGRGTLEAEYRLTSLRRVHLSTATYSQGIVCRGAPTAGTCFVSIPTMLEPSLYPTGTAAGDECTFQADGREFVQAVPGRYRLLVVVLDQSAIQAAMQSYWGLPLDRVVRSGVFLTRGHPSRSGLRDQVERLGDLAASGEIDGGHGAAMSLEIEEDLLAALVSAALPGGSLRVQPDRQRLARRAAAILRDDVNAPEGLASVAMLLRTTLRSLELGFQEVYGMSPREFRHLLRLQRAREDLRHAAPGETVGQIAMRNGLFHLGRFSVSYRKVFGESPNETLRASQRSAA